MAAHVDSAAAEKESRRSGRLLKTFLLWVTIFVVVILLYNVFAR